MELSKKQLVEMQERNLARLVKNGEPKFTDKWFPYTSGQIGPYYIQSIAVCNDGGDYAGAVQDLSTLILSTVGTNAYDAIFGGESRDYDFSNPTAVLLKKPHVKLYKDKDPIGTIAGRKLIGVSDLNNEGSSYENQWVPTIRNNGGEIEAAFFFVDRLEDGVGVLKNLKIPSYAVAPFNQNAWDYLQRIGKVDNATYHSLCERNEDKQAWAHQKLFAHPEILENLLNGNKSSQEKGFKILNVGYPEISVDMLNLLNSRKNVIDLDDKFLAYATKK